jgi:uncharacterized protein with PIN domain
VVISRATVRLYGDLATFVPERTSSIEVRFGVPGSVKDAIEALGVPHTEVDLVLMDGEPVGWGTRLRPGARVAVYPWFGHLDLSGVSPVHVPVPEQRRFVADVHLARMARYLRLVGCDVLHRNDFREDEIVDLATVGDRIVLTRDVGLLKRSAVRHGYFVRSLAAVVQAGEVVRRFDLVDGFRPFSRCMACNGVLADVTGHELGDRVSPPEAHGERRRCPECGRTYWRGSHHRRLQEIVEALGGAGVRGTGSPRSRS